MSRSLAASAAVGLFLVFARCAEQPADPEGVFTPAFDAGGTAACPLEADVVVTDEASLLAALAVASPGDVIGLDGYFVVTADVEIYTEDLTLTCVSPGSGMYAEPGAGLFDIVAAYADGVRVDRLVLDAPEARDGAFFAWYAEHVTFSNNRVTCKPDGYCAFFAGTPGAIVEGNHFEAAGSFTGVHMQWGIDNSRVERNTIVTTMPQTTAFWYGGIRVRDGSDVLVHKNTVLGPWTNSIHASALTNSQFKDNTLEGADVDGISMWSNVHNNVVRNNKATGMGEAGVFADAACGNTFIGNNFNGNYNDYGAWSWLETGANTLVGNQNVVIDDGDYDCDGDGMSDPNIITGQGAVEQGVNLGEKVSDAASSWKDIK